MANAYRNKIVFAGETLIDLTADTATAEKVLSGYTFHDKSGATVSGTCTYDADTTLDNGATKDEILKTKSAWVNGSKVDGAMANNGAVAGTISTIGGSYTVPVGYHDGSGKVTIAYDSTAFVAKNIREGVTLLGVTGTMSGSEDMKPQAKTVTPTSTGTTVNPDEGYNCLSTVTVEAIPYSETDNSAGGKTVTIGAA